MISPEDSPKSGRFVLRMPPTLHADLQASARASGLSLNQYCVRQLSAAQVGVVGDDDATALLARARSLARDALSGVVLHGSWVRGEAAPASDVDALIVVERSLALGRALYRRWDAEPVVMWQGRRIDPHFAHQPSAGRLSGLWAEVALDGIVLFERDRKVSAHLARIRREVAAGRLVRRVVHGQPYWKQAG